MGNGQAGASHSLTACTKCSKRCVGDLRAPLASPHGHGHGVAAWAWAWRIRTRHGGAAARDHRRVPSEGGVRRGVRARAVRERPRLARRAGLRAL
eukprot:scaffold66090_cov78-Phaeocystis_antarctica.AAC.2